MTPLSSVESYKQLQHDRMSPPSARSAGAACCATLGSLLCVKQDNHIAGPWLLDAMLDSNAYPNLLDDIFAGRHAGM